MDLKKIGEEINELLEIRRKELNLVFIEDKHIYYMKDSNGKIRSNYPSVSKIIKKFHKEFNADQMALKMSKGDVNKQKELLKEWKEAGQYSLNVGSRVHYLLESETLSKFGSNKTVRTPIFDCDDAQIKKSDQMITAGKTFLNLMKEREAVLLDTEVVLGDPDLGYTGQPDKTWLMLNKEKNDFGLVITDWKTNQPKNFVAKHYNEQMYPPFNNYVDTALSHYYLQLPLYARLMIKMLENTKYNDIKLLGCVIVLLKDDGSFQEYKVPPEINSTVLNFDITRYTKNI